jgi:hypothetical protein
MAERWKGTVLRGAGQPIDGRAGRRLSPKERVDLGTVSPLFVASLATEVVPGGNKQQYAVSSDGQRFLMNVASENRPVTPITIILNWKPPL